MIHKIDHKKMGRSTSLGWLDSHFHFSFAEYYNPDNMSFGVLRVLNDDLIKPNNGFGEHPHNDMEIISYIVDGELTHGDSMGNKETLKRGHVQYMSAGTGVIHSEENFGSEIVRLLQIWILPNQHGLTPNYGDLRYPWEDRINKWLHIVSGQSEDAAVKIHQDVNLYVTLLEKGQELVFEVASGRQAYLVVIEGEAVIEAETLVARDALTSVEEDLLIQAREDAHIIILEMEKNNYN